MNKKLFLIPESNLRQMSLRGENRNGNTDLD